MSITIAMKKMKNIPAKIKCILLTLLLTVPGFALAARDTNPICTGSEIPVTINFGTVSVQRDAAVGEVLATVQTGALNGGSGLGGCSPSPWSATNPPNFSSDGSAPLYTTLSALGSGIYDTNVAGVGIRITFTDGANNNMLMPFSKIYSLGSSIIVRNITVELIKTAATIGTGTLRTGVLAQQTFYTSATNVGTGWAIGLIGTSTLAQVACSVTNTNINVPMDSVKNIDFKGRGTTTSEKSFNIPLSCDAGTKVNVTLDAGSSGSYDASIGVINLDSSVSTAASGIGLQILSNSTPVTMGTLMSIGTTASAGVFNIPLTARYYQTGSSVKPGTANATATFTMTYK
ncbi:fimbrial protein [Pantoea agglomerans]|uniref:fimbrial protein n=1 Tax=Enterobacter agglomerans TaxID=549 RepID=UPI003DA11498